MRSGQKGQDSFVLGDLDVQGQAPLTWFDSNSFTTVQVAVQVVTYAYVACSEQSVKFTRKR